MLAEDDPDDADFDPDYGATGGHSRNKVVSMCVKRWWLFIHLCATLYSFICGHFLNFYLNEFRMMIGKLRIQMKMW